MTTRLMYSYVFTIDRSSTEDTTPPRSAHVRLGDVPRTHDLVELRGRASSARQRDDDDDVAIGTGLRLSTATILSRWMMVDGGTTHG